MILKDSLKYSDRTVSSPRDLRQAILQTVAYSDIFDYPLTIEEIHRYLIGNDASLAVVSEVINHIRNLETQAGYYTLPGRIDLVRTRSLRTKIASALWSQAIRYGRIVSNFPFVKMVAVTGALAMSNVDSDADVDYLIVTKPGRLWTVRAMVLGLERIRVTGATICPNYLLSEAALSLEDKDLFTAQELVRMAPLSGFATYQRLRRENNWTSRYLPNAIDPPNQSHNISKPYKTIKTFGEIILTASPGDRFEQWEMSRKISMLTRKSASSNGEFGTEARFGPDWCKGHFDDHGAKTMVAFERRLTKLDISYSE
ncbi:MAG: hypothetical protein IH859_05580 [Chloroflexi bacterium]|nr:hypothetical protein [Chloroflexota bacterium]